MVLRSNPGAAGLACAILVMFLIQVLLGHSDGTSVVRVGAMGPRFWTHGHVWTLASSTLIHLGVVHALFNAYFVWAIGGPFERAAGTGPFLVVFFVGGLVGSLLSAMLFDGVSAGASGGGWGLMIALLLLSRWPTLAGNDEQPALNSQGILTLVVMNAVFSFLPGINGLAHLGGGIGGGLVFAIGSFGPRIGWWVLGTGLTALHVLAVVTALWVGFVPPGSGVGIETSVLEGLVTTVVPEGLDAIEGTLDVTHGDFGWDRVVVVTDLVLDDTPLEHLVLQMVGPTTANPCPDSPGFDLMNSTGSLTVRDYGIIKLFRLVIVDPESRWSDFATQHRCAVRLTPDSLAFAHFVLETSPSPVVIQTYEALLKEFPENPWLLNQLAWHLASSTVDEVRNGARAVKLAEKAVALESNTARLDTLAAAYAESGRFSEAVATQEQVVARPDANDANRAALVLLRQGHPIREARSADSNTAP